MNRRSFIKSFFDRFRLKTYYWKYSLPDESGMLFYNARNKKKAQKVLLKNNNDPRLINVIRYKEPFAIYTPKTIDEIYNNILFYAKLLKS
jgi:hypothetical protein